MIKYDITILTDHRYVNPELIDNYIQNVLDEDRILKEALEEKGLKIHRINWDHPSFDWSSTRYILFRTTWDYFERFDEFSAWLNEVSDKTQLINQKELIYWNIDKHYLKDLSDQGIRIPKTTFIEAGDSASLKDYIICCGWEEFILKPAVSGAARHTYRFKKADYEQHSTIFKELIEVESLLLQEYQNKITSKGEVAFMIFGGKYSHAVLKKAKPGDFRVQDDFGGSLHDYDPSDEEIEFAEKAISVCDPMPVYARVDVIWNNEDQLCVGEIELIEPELWFRRENRSAKRCASAILDYIS
jgi:glutathione synthase/RimK-type ligase-like ATP-grasp enzyme